MIFYENRLMDVLYNFFPKWGTGTVISRLRVRFQSCLVQWLAYKIPITFYFLRLYTDSCYIDWFGASFCIATSRMSKPWYHCSLDTHSEKLIKKNKGMMKKVSRKIPPPLKKREKSCAVYWNVNISYAMTRTSLQSKDHQHPSLSNMF